MGIKSYVVEKGDPKYPKGTKVIYDCRIWYYKNGKQLSKYQKGFLKKKDAEEWGVSTKSRLEKLHIDTNKENLESLLEKWIKTKKNLAPTTLNGYKVNINHMNEYLGNMKVVDIEQSDIQDMVDELEKKGFRKNTIKYICRNLHNALQYAIKNKYIGSNPCFDIEYKDDESQFEASIYSADDLRNLLLKLKEQEHILYIPVLLASTRGLRRGECLGLAWKDIDFNINTLYVRNNYVKVDKIGIHKKVKTKDSERATSIEGLLGEELIEYRKRTNKKKRQLKTYICEKEDGTLPDPSHISRMLSSFQKANNLPICRFHDLRHTFAVLQLEMGTDLDTLRRLLGHSKISITSDIYLHQNMTLIKQAVTSMDNVISLKNEKQHNNDTIEAK